jgi:hypothetical protein
MWYSNLEKAFISRHILHQRWYTSLIALPVRRNPQHRSLLTVVSAISAPPFQPLRHQRYVCHPAVNRFMRWTLPTVNRKISLWISFALSPFAHKKKNKRKLLLGSTQLKHGHHFDCWNQPLNMRMRVCYLDCHEAGLCYYLVIRIENVLRPLQLFYFHLWPMYWLGLVLVVSNLHILLHATVFDSWS